MHNHQYQGNEFDYISSTNQDMIDKNYDQLEDEDENEYYQEDQNYNEYYDDDEYDDEYDDDEQNLEILNNKQGYNNKIVKNSNQNQNYDDYQNEEDIYEDDQQQEDQYNYENYDDEDDYYDDEQEEDYDEQGEYNSQIEEQQEQYYDQMDEEIAEQKQQYQKPKSQPKISDAGFRILNFEIRKNDPTLPRNVVKRTVRDEEGKRVNFNGKSIESINLEKQVNQVQEIEQTNYQFKKINLDEKGQEKNQQNMKNIKIKQAIEKLRKANQQRKLQKYQFEDYNYDEWHGFQFTEEMHSPQDLQFVQDRIVNYNSIFEVDEQFNFDKNLLIKPYIRSNQGRVDLNFRSQKAIIKSMTRLIEIIVNRNQIHKDGTNVSYLDIFEYVHDRFRAIVTELTQIDSKNSVSQFRIIVLEKIIRFYLYSYYEMLILKDNKQALENIIAIKKYLGKYVTCLCEDYLNMLNICSSDNQLFDNVPEFIQYQFLINLLEHQSFDSVQRMSQLGNDLMNHNECYKKVIQTQEYQFIFQIQEYIITKNFYKIKEILKFKLTFFQSLFIYLIVEMFHKIKDRFLKKCFVFVSDNFFPDLDDLLSDLISLNPQQISLELITKSSELINKYNDIEQCQNISVNEIRYKQPQIKKQQSIVVNRFHKFSQQLLLKKTLQELKPLISLAEAIENEKVQFYIKKMRFNHWQKIYRTMKKQKYYDQILQQPKCTLTERPYQRKNAQYNFFNCIAIKLAQNFPSIENYYYKIVFIYSDFQYLKQFYHSLCRIQFEESYSMNIDFKYLNKSKSLQIHIQCINEIQGYKLIGSDLIFNLQELNQDSFNKTIIIMERNKQYQLLWNDIQMFDNLLENITFNDNINKIIEESLVGKVFYPKLKTISFIQIISSLKEKRYLPCNNHFQSDNFETFLSYCFFWDFYLNTLLNQHINDFLPQEIFFDQYLIDQNIQHYVDQYNLLTKLAFSFLNQLNSELTTFKILIRIISKFLNDSIDQQVYEEIFYKNFEMMNNRKQIKGNWSMLYDQIVTDMMLLLQESDQYFILLDSYEISLNLSQLDLKIEAFIKSLNIKQPKIELDEDEKLMQWIKKKMSK